MPRSPDYAARFIALHGELDEYGSAEHPNHIAAGRGTALILPETGHVPHRENEALVVEAIRGFFNLVL